MTKHIIEVTLDTFNQAVIEQSKHIPVLVDFWAPWCAPCKTLMPVLEKLAEDYQGQFILAKVNTADQETLGTQYGVRSIPNVKLFSQGQAIDEFSGALPETDIRHFLDKHLSNPSLDISHQLQQLLAQGKGKEALTLLETALKKTPNSIDLVLSYAHLQISAGNYDIAESCANQLDEEQQKLTDIKAIHARIRFEKVCQNATELDYLEKLDSPDNENLYQLAAYYVLASQPQAALENLLTIFQKDRTFQNGVAKAAILDIFNILGNSGDIVNHYRSKLFNLLH